MMIEFASWWIYSFFQTNSREFAPTRKFMFFTGDAFTTTEQQWRIRENLKYSYLKTIPTKKYMFYWLYLPLPGKEKRK